MLTRIICLVVLLAVSSHADNVRLTSNKRRRFTCPGDQVVFTCQVFKSSSLEWRSPLITQTTTFSVGSTHGERLFRGQFIATLTDVNGGNLQANFTSTLQITASRNFTRDETTVMCLNGSQAGEAGNFTVAEMPAPPQNVRVSPERVSGTNTILWVKWMRPQNFDKFDIDRYYITVTWRSGMAPDIQGTTVTAPGESTHTLITVKENETEQYNATVVARSFCERSSAGTRVHLSLWEIILAIIALALTKEE